MKICQNKRMNELETFPGDLMHFKHKYVSVFPNKEDGIREKGFQNMHEYALFSFLCLFNYK